MCGGRGGGGGGGAGGRCVCVLGGGGGACMLASELESVVFLLRQRLCLQGSLLNSWIFTVPTTAE